MGLVDDCLESFSIDIVVVAAAAVIVTAKLLNIFPLDILWVVATGLFFVSFYPALIIGTTPLTFCFWSFLVNRNRLLGATKFFPN